jgi:hypothetical protein
MLQLGIEQVDSGKSTCRTFLGLVITGNHFYEAFVIG